MSPLSSHQRRILQSIGVSRVWLNWKTSSRGDAITTAASGSISLAVWLPQRGLIRLHLITGIYSGSSLSRTWRDKQAIDESGVMHGLTGTDSARPMVNMCRRDRISTLAARRRIYLALAWTPNSTELQLPRLRGADNTCKRLHSQHYQHWDPVYASHRLTEHDFAGGISDVEWWSLVGAQAHTASTRAARTCVFSN